MQGLVSKTGGTDAGVFPKYKNDINKYYKYSLNPIIIYDKRLSCPIVLECHAGDKTVSALHRIRS